MEKRSKGILFVFTALLACAVILGLLLKPSKKPMPVYQGRTADEWLEATWTNQNVAADAFEGMGTNGLAYLVNVFRERDSAFSKAWRDIYPKLPHFVLRRTTFPQDAAYRWSAAGILLDDIKAEAAVPGLLQLLTDKRNKAHVYILSALLNEAGPDCTDWVPVLTQCLQEPDYAARQWASVLLGKIGPNAKAVLPALNTIMLVETNDQSRLAEASALWSIGRQTDGAWFIQNSFITSRDPWFQRGACMYLSEIGCKDPAIIPTLSKLVTDSDYSLSYSAATLLGGFGPTAKSAVPALEQAYQLRSKDDRQFILDALLAIDPTNAVKYAGKDLDEARKPR